MKQAVDKVNLWFDKVDMNAVNEYDLGDVKPEPWFLLIYLTLFLSMEEIDSIFFKKYTY